jgi:hypothetical protein
MWTSAALRRVPHSRNSFIVENQTDKVLHVSGLQKSCSCSSLTSDKKILSPGEKCTVRMETSLLGRFSKQTFSGAVIFSPEDRMPPIRLFAAGVVHARIEVDPQVLDFGLCRPDSGRLVRKARLSATGYGESTRVSRVRSESPWITATFDAVSTSAPCLGEITVVFDPERVIGPFEARVDAFLDPDKKPAASCTVKAHVRSDFLIKPSSLLLRQTQGEALAEVHIQHYTGKQVRIVGVKTSRGNVRLSKVVESTMDGGGATCLQVAVSTGEDELSRGEIFIDLALEDGQEIHTVRVPFVCTGHWAI